MWQEIAKCRHAIGLFFAGIGIIFWFDIFGMYFCSVWQCVEVICNVLQCVAEWLALVSGLVFLVYVYVVVSCMVLQGVAVHCSKARPYQWKCCSVLESQDGCF